MLGGFQEVEFDFIADNPGPSLFHCHQQLHMDFGFMALFNYRVEKPATYYVLKSILHRPAIACRLDRGCGLMMRCNNGRRRHRCCFIPIL